MIRVLHVYPQLNNAGTEMVIMNLYRNIDREQIQFDFLVQKQGELDDTVRDMGAKIFYIDHEGDYNKLLLDFFKGHPEYTIVHTHTHQEMGTVLKMAARAGVPHRIAHSHNYRGDVPRFMKYYKMIKGWSIERYATHFRACSKEAASWLFPRKYKQCEVWNNAIELERFLFDGKTRVEYRKLFNIPEEAKVVCHVGRFAEQKNHKRIVTLLNKLTEKRKDIYALLVGVGPLLDEMRSMASSDKIMFLGNRRDVPKVLSAADVFLFPSLYEGLGIVAIEAQASGLKCIASTNVPAAADVGTNTFEQISLEANDEIWLESMERALDKSDRENRAANSKAVLATDYNIKKVASEVQSFYLSLK